MMRSIAMGEGGEFDVVRAIIADVEGLPAVDAVGDDAAVVPGTDLVISTDVSVEGVHFRRSWLDWDEVGYRAGAVALSDLAGVAARPLGVLVGISAPRELDRAAVVALGQGARRAAAAAGAALLGGDLTGSPGPVSLAVTVIGVAARPVGRAGACVGDGVWVTGSLGRSASAVRCWELGDPPPAELREAFCRPVPRIAEALWLRDRVELHALIDLSDGLAGDAGHLAAASGVAVLLSGELLPLPPAFAHLELARGEAEHLAFHGGEDYELCFTAEDAQVEALRKTFAQTFGLTLTRVGEVGAGSGVWIDGARVTGPGGFDHFE